ncbi:hypothetical protein RND71_026940 [Anisodus tanguticus]|uniref:Uncharacterized protein n=1 Tax=Anisodus tanguticus TaxID=243964 RepID=A0AAE1V8R4_9SOLA|nr:hypothetical protein RND71_026940 [Anisodus tanguticus]
MEVVGSVDVFVISGFIGTQLPRYVPRESVIRGKLRNRARDRPTASQFHQSIAPDLVMVFLD